MTQPAPIKPYSTKELCALYDIGSRTFYSWMGKIKTDLLGPQIGNKWNVRQVKFMFEHWGHPETQTNTNHQNQQQ